MSSNRNRELLTTNDRYLEQGFFWRVFKGRFGFYHYEAVRKKPGSIEIIKIVKGRRQGYWNAVDAANFAQMNLMNEWADE